METEIYSGEEMEFTLKLAGAFTKNRSHSMIINQIQEMVAIAESAAAYTQY